MIPPWVAVALAVVAFVGCLLFVATYAFRRWWESDVGRNTMSFAATETAMLGLALAGLFGRIPGQQLIAHLLFAVMAAVAWWRWVTLIRARPKISSSEGNGNA